MSEEFQKYVSKCLKQPDSFFDNYPEYRDTVNVTAIEVIHHTRHATGACKDYFYACMADQCMADQRMARVMACRPFAESALVTRLKVCLDSFTAKVADLAGECRDALKVSVEAMMRELDQTDSLQPQLADRLPGIVESFVGKRWLEREESLKAEIRQWYNKVIWRALEDIEERVNSDCTCKAMPFAGSVSDSRSDQTESELDIQEYRFSAAKAKQQPVSYRPPMSASIGMRSKDYQYSETTFDLSYKTESVTFRGLSKKFFSKINNKKTG